jgi:hypothetical protein
VTLCPRCGVASPLVSLQLLAEIAAKEQAELKRKSEEAVMRDTVLKKVRRRCGDFST